MPSKGEVPRCKKLGVVRAARICIFSFETLNFLPGLSTMVVVDDQFGHVGAGKSSL
jgi:hypothetical protein